MTSKTVKEWAAVEEAKNADETTSSQTIAKPTVMRSYSLNEVREIALEYRNTCMYGHSHKLTRFELQDELRKIDKKHDLDYKEGVDYTLG